MRTATEGKPKHHNTVITAPETRKHIALKKKEMNEKQQFESKILKV